MSALAKRLLERFPAHYVADRPGKRLGHVVDSLAGDLELLATQLAGVRRAHRLGHAGTLDDLFLLSGLHGITRAEAGLLFRRVELLETGATDLLEVAGGPEEDRADAAAAILGFWGVESPETALSLFAPDTGEGQEPDLEAAAGRLAAAARSTVSFDALVERVRDRVRATATIHQAGNGTVAAVLDGVANALDLELDRSRNRVAKAELAARNPDALDLRIQDDLFHSRDHFHHASFVRDRAPLVREVPTALPANLVRIAGPTSVFELALLMDADPTELLATARGRDPAIADVDTLLDFEAAEAVAADHDFVLERAFRSRIRLRGPIPAAALARSAGVPLPRLLERLETLGVDADEATELGPDTTAAAVRYWGVRVDEVLHDTADVVGLEENPLRRFTYEDQDAPHGHRFTILRKGFGRTLMRAEVEGLADPDREQERTVGPMLVNRDEGRGIGYFGTVPDGQTLEFQEEGRVFLDGTDVTDHAYSWKGACFADATARHENDFVFRALTSDGDRWARFAEATPPGALDREATFPHDGAAVEMPGVAVGATRMAFFVQVNRLSSREGTAEEPVIRTPTPHPFIGFADRSLFAVPAVEGGPLPPPGYPVAARVLVSWLEHEAYAARIFIPARFEALESDTAVADRLRAAVERFRPAGVDLRVEYIDDRWTLGEGTLTTEGGGDPLSLIRGGTVLWPTPADDD